LCVADWVGDSWGGRFLSGRQPDCKLFGDENAEGGVHAVVAEAAELGAENRIGAGGGGCEVDVDGLAGDGVLLEAKFGDGEAVDDVLRVEAEIDFAVGGEDEFGGDFVVGGVGVGGIETEGVAFAGGDEAGAGDAEGCVGAGVAEVPGELHAGDLDLEGGGRGPGIAGDCPEALGLDGEEGEEKSERSEGKVFDAPEVGGFGAAAGEETYQEDEVCQGEESEGDPEVEKKMVVERGAVSAGVGGKEPRWGEKERRVAGKARLAGVEHGLRIARSVW
jgi:hypothetical protein